MKPNALCYLNLIDLSYLVCGRRFSTLITHPDLDSIFPSSQNFSKGANFSYNFSRSLPIKNVPAYIPLDYYTTPDPINCVHNLVARFHNFKIILLIVHYKYSNLVIDASRSDSGTRLRSTGLIT